MPKDIIQQERTRRIWQRERAAGNLLPVIPEASLEEARIAANELADHFSDERNDMATGQWLYWHVAAAIELEQARRVEELAKARLLVEANGHEVEVTSEEGEWYAVCSCEMDLGLEDVTLAGAEAIAQRHADQAGGRFIAAEVAV